jgi:hypothetical protein
MAAYLDKDVQRGLSTVLQCAADHALSSKE